MDKILERAKAVAAAVIAAAIAALAGVDWWAIVAVALGSGGIVEEIPNKKPKPKSKAKPGRVRK
jgi:hypothetical protein